METIELLAATLGIAALSGISLYLTVFITGLALSQGWISLSPGLSALEVLNNPIIIVVAGIFYFFEFFADKVPWVDSLWDVLHSAIRPLGAVVISLAALGELHPVAQILAVLACGGVATATHLTKATSRLVTNIVPEPISKIAVSAGEDVLVVGGTFLALTHPLILFVILVVGLVLLIWIAPKLVRHALANFNFTIAKLSARDGLQPVPLDRHHSSSLWQRVSATYGPETKIEWSLRAYTGKIPGIAPNHKGHVVGLLTPEPLLCLIPLSARVYPQSLPMEGLESKIERAFLFDELHLFSRKDQRAWVVRFRKSDYGKLLSLHGLLQNESDNTATQASDGSKNIEPTEKDIKSENRQHV